MFKTSKKFLAVMISILLLVPFSNIKTYAIGTAKILVVGNFLCGKTQMCRVICGYPYDEHTDASALEKCTTFNISGVPNPINLWDTVALDLEYSRVMELAKGAHIVFVLHDTEKKVTPESFKYIEKLYSDLISKVSPGCRIAAVCTKADTKAENILNFVKSYRQLKDIFESLGCGETFVISSKKGEGFDEIREYIKRTLSEMVLPDTGEEQLLVEDSALSKRIKTLRNFRRGTEKPKGESEEVDKNWYKNWREF